MFQTEDIKLNIEYVRVSC